MPLSPLLARLGQVRRRLLVIEGAAGAAWAAVLAIGVLLAGVWLDLVWDLSPRARIAVLAAVTLAAGMLFTWLVTRIVLQARESLLARRLDRAAEAGGVVVSGWELQAAERAKNDDVANPLTRGLAVIAVERAASAAAQAPLDRAVPSRPLRVSFASLVALAAVIALAAVCLPRLASVEWRRFANPFADTPPFSWLVFDVQPGNVTVLYGQGVEIRAAVSGGLAKRVELAIEQGDGATEFLPMFADSENVWRTALARVTDDARYYIRADRARSERYSLRVITTPRIESVRFRISPPAYTRESPYEGPLPQGGVAGLAGARVQVWARSNRPLSGGSLQLTDEAGALEVALRPSGREAEVVAGEFTLRATGRFALRVVDVEGQPSQESFDGAVVRLVDERPFVRLVEPREISLATPTAHVPVTLAGEDDYGVSLLQLFRNLNNSRPRPLDVALPPPPPRRAQERVYLPLAKYGLSPGDEIKLFARVEDNDPAGAKGAESEVAVIRIISQEEFERMVRARQGLEVLLSKYQQAQRRLEQLAAAIEEVQKKLEQAPAGSPLADDLRQEFQELGERLAQDSQAIEAAADSLLPYDLDKNLTEQLRQLAASAAEAAKSLEDALGQSDLTHGEARERLAELAQGLQGARRKFAQEATEPLEHLALVFPLKEDEAKFTVLVMRQIGLAERLASLKDRSGEDDPRLKARMRELEDEQRRLRVALAELLDDIEYHAERLPDEPPFDQLRESALEFAQAVRASFASEAMAEAEAGLAAFSGSDGYANAKEAAEILKRFLSQCQGMGEKAGQCLAFQPGLSESLGNTIEQLLAEMGMGSGPGQGSGSGYSAQRSTLSNIGLYGGLPALGNVVQSGVGQGIAQSGGSGGAFGQGGADEPTLVEAASLGTAGGVGEGAVPPQYRRRVGLYFQRILEGDRP